MGSKCGLAARREGSAVITALRPAADPVAAAVQPDHDWKMRGRRGLRSPDIEIETILRGIDWPSDIWHAISRGLRRHEGIGAIHILHAWVRGLRCVTYARPCSWQVAGAATAGGLSAERRTVSG